MSLIDDQKRIAMCEALHRMGIRNKSVLKSMVCIPRHCFVPSFLKDQAYENGALPIGYDQTISQPYMVALMCEAAALKPSARVLEIGTGSGYGAAVLAGLAAHVYSIEIIPELREAAQTLLKKLGYSNVRVLQGDGSIGLLSEVLRFTINDLIRSALIEMKQSDFSVHIWPCANLYGYVRA